MASAIGGRVSFRFADLIHAGTINIDGSELLSKGYHMDMKSWSHHLYDVEFRSIDPV